MSNAKVVRERLLKNGVELINKLEEVALHGKDDFEGDLISLQLLVKQISPMIKLVDDQMKLPTGKNREESLDYVVVLLNDGQITSEQAIGYAKAIREAQSIFELKELEERLLALEQEDNK